MENTTFDLLDNDYPLNYGPPEVPTSRASLASPAAERADQPSGEHALPLLQLSGWESEKQYDKSQLEEIVGHIKGNMEEGDMEEDINVSVEILPNILKNCKVHALAYNRCYNTAEMPPGEELGDVEGDRQAKLEEYCTWGPAQVKSDR
ncbi:hypothetical protein NA56DRAFT_708062 [Hyaloscypha hepaticicola]|uniref:Uncharacterized protein n=1 Tax=Hyaloscypha hepaticicola TaxID=2082293 RepID=A0A2J6PT31_9HELO|nr:hypothetical protein NA56DRAFT_708062 [Hyaloscypha hepaticicola]